MVKQFIKYLYVQSDRILSKDVARNGGHTKPSRWTNSKMQLPEHTYDEISVVVHSIQTMVMSKLYICIYFVPTFISGIIILYCPKTLLSQIRVRSALNSIVYHLGTCVHLV